jgi:AcrR family transcriptional regulator
MVNRHSLSRGAPQKLRERLKAATSDAILDAAEQVFATEGVQKARMESIALAAGVAVGTLYNHFETREALFAELLAVRRASFSARLDEVLAACDGRPFAEQLRAFLQEASRHLEEHQTFLRILMETEHMSGKAKFGREVLYKRAQELIARGVKQKALRSDDVEHFPTLLMSMMRTCMTSRLYHDAPPLEEILGPVVRFFVEGAGRR